MAKRNSSGVINFDDDAFKILTAQVQAKNEENRINQATLNVLKRKESIATDVLERYSNLGEQVKPLVALVEAVLSRLDAVELVLNDSKLAITTELKTHAAILREVAEELSRRFDIADIEQSRRMGRLEDIVRALLSKTKLNPIDVETWLSGLTVEHMQRELKQHYINLSMARDAATKYGMNVPIHLRNEISYAEERIADLEEELNATKSAA